MSDKYVSCAMQIKVTDGCYSSKRITPFFIGDDELLEYGFQAFKESLVREVPHFAKITSLPATPIRVTMNDQKRRGRPIASVF